MLSLSTLVTKPLLNLRVLVELLLVFLVSLEVEPTEPVKELLETCVEEVECSPLPRSGEDGTERAILTKEDSPSLLPWLPLLCQL